MTVHDLGPAARSMAQVAGAITDDQLSDPSPCPDWPVGAVLDHVMGLSLAFAGAAEKVPDQGGPTADAARLPADWRATLPRRLARLAEAWTDPAAWEGMTTAGGVTMPADVMGVVALNELVMHGWDLARATGQEFAVEPADAAACLTFTEQFSGPGQDEARAGLFGPELPAPKDAPAFHRLLAGAGRDRGWQPPQGVSK